MPMLGPRITNGLNAWGIQVTFELNPFYAQVVPQDDIIDMRVFVIDDGKVVIFDPIEAGEQAFIHDQSSYHKDDGETRASPQHTPTGLDPQADPAASFAHDQSSYHKDDGEVPAAPQHTPTGLDPQADPPKVFIHKVSKNDDCD
jgi:hypothetical protein